MIVLTFAGLVVGQACSEYGNLESSNSASSSTNIILTSGSTTVAANTQTQINATGGVPPYSWSVDYGGGVISSLSDSVGVYTAPSSLGAASNTAMISCSDSIGNMAHLSLSLSNSALSPTSGISVLSSLSISMPGLHRAGGGGCTTPATDVGQVADGFGNTVIGEQIFCASYVALTNNTQIITDIVISPSSGGTHAMSPTCPIGYAVAGAVSDCVGGSCAGYQYICAKLANSGNGGSPILDFKVTTGANHFNPPNCGSLTAIGYTADCQGGTCSGYQAFCLRK